jgi:hypothetical protein
MQELQQEESTRVFCQFLEAFTHTVLYARDIYPPGYSNFGFLD